MLSNVQQVRRQLKNVAYNFTDAQVKVREATSNDPWGPSSSLMSEVADMTYNSMAFTEVMQMIWKRLNDSGKNWRHVYKSLVLLDYLIKTGSEKVAQQCKENIYAIQTLKDFQHIEENKDQGMNVREKAKQLVSLLKDDERLKNERARALMAKKRFAQNSMGISSDGSALPQNPTSQRRMYRSESEMEEARPSNVGEEELQLQIALALSREEAEREAEARRGDDVRLQMAISESQTNEGEPVRGAHSSSSFNGQSSGNNLNDLLGLSNGGGGNGWTSSSGHTGGLAGLNDPWGTVSSPVADSQPDPWASIKTPPSKAVTNADPWAPISLDSVSNANNDPFAPLSMPGSTSNGQHPAPSKQSSLIFSKIQN